MTNDPIVAEVREVRDKHAAQFGYDIKEIFKQGAAGIIRPLSCSSCDRNVR